MAKIWTKTDPWLSKRIARSKLIRQGDIAITNAVMAAMDQWLANARRAIYRLPAAGNALTADTGDASETTGLPANSLPDLTAWPTAASWQVILDQNVSPEASKLFGLAFAEATREADIQDAHYVQAYVAMVEDRLSTNLWSEGIFEEVREVISEGIAKGLSITHITEELSGVLDVDASAWQARRIARTETMGAVNAGTWNGASAYGELMGETQFKQWYATEDSRTREDHVNAHKQVVPIASKFNVGGFSMDFPGDPEGPPSEVCNCRCTLLILSASEAAEFLKPEDWAGPAPGVPEAAEPPPDATEPPPEAENDALETSVTASTAELAGPAPVIAPGSTPPVVLPPDQQTDTAASGDVGYWYGVLAPLDTASADGRVIATPAPMDDDGNDTTTGGQPEPRTRPLPIPLLWQDSLSPGHDGAVAVGLITDAWIQDGNLMGCGTFDMDDPRAAAIAKKVQSGNLGWVSVDLDDTTMELQEDGDDEYGGLMVASDWRLMAATLVSQPAFPQAKITTGRPDDADPGDDTELDDDEIGIRQAAAIAPAAPPHPGTPIGQRNPHPMPGAPTSPHDGATGPAAPAKKSRPPLPSRPRSATTAPGPRTGLSRGQDAPAGPNPGVAAAALFRVLPPSTSLPVADAGHTWDSAAAAQRVADWARGGDGEIDPAKYATAFLYRDDDADPTNVTGYKLGYADVVNGELTIVPKGVYAVAGALGGARTPLAVPAEQKPGLKSATEKLYGRVSDALDDKEIKAPWETASTRRRPGGAASFRAGSDTFTPPLAWFQNPAFPSYTNVTVSDDGRIYGHLAPWGQCHTGRSDRCYTAPKSPSGYAYFHQGTVRVAEGMDVAVGTVHMGTDHANTRINAADAQRHYADTGMASAVVRAGEDAFGIWIAGAILPGADLVTLRRAAWSGDWRRVGPAMELCGVLSVNQPGFPVPRPSWTTDDRGVVLALTAAAGTACARADVPSGKTVMAQFTSEVAAELAVTWRKELAADRARQRRWEAAMERMNKEARKVRAERRAKALAALKKGGS